MPNVLSLNEPPPLIRRYIPSPTDTEQVMAISRILFSGGMCNKHCNKPEAVAARIIAGRELGLSDVQSVNWIAIINGRAVIWGDAALALVRASGLIDGDVTETIEGEGDERKAVCVSKRKGAPGERRTEFSVADAKKANLWDKPGPWQEYLDRQLMWRARGWNLRDNFNDVLCGLGIAEEELDIPVRVVGSKVDLPATAPELPAAPVAVNAEVMASDAQIHEIATARGSWLRGRGVDPNNQADVLAEWTKLLAEYGVTSARQLTQDRAKELYKRLVAEGHKQEVKEVFAEAAAN